jgi:hypothetical protein
MCFDANNNDVSGCRKPLGLGGAIVGPLAMLGHQMKAFDHRGGLVSLCFIYL